MFPQSEVVKIPKYLRNADEVLEPEQSHFIGRGIPSWLKGSLISSSPGLFDLEEGSVLNWFDGYGLLSKFSIDGPSQSVTFTSRFLESNAYKKAREAGRPIFPEFGTPPAVKNGRSVFAKFLPFTPNDCTDNVVGTIFKIQSSLFLAGDTCYYHEIDPESLSVIKSHHTFKAFGLNSISSQPLVDPKDGGSIYLIGEAISPTFRYNVLKLKPNKKEVVETPLLRQFSLVSSFPSRWMFGACPCRNFGMTENYIVMVEMPLVLNLMKFAATFVKGYCATDWLDWRPHDRVKFCVVDKRNGGLVKSWSFYAKESFFSHTIINAFEVEDETGIVLDLISQPNLDCNNFTKLEHLRNRPKVSVRPSERPFDSGTIHRYVIPLSESCQILDNPHYSSLSSTYASNNNEVILTPEPLSEPGLGTDFTTINPTFRGRRARYVYLTSGYISNPFSPYAYGVTKLNLETKEIKVWRGKYGQAVSEPIFIPKPNDKLEEEEEEDNGVILALVKIENEEDTGERDFLLALDARTMGEVGRAYFSSSVAGWYHATFFQD